MDGRTIRKSWIVLPALSFVAGVVFALLIWNSLPVPGPMGVSSRGTPTVGHGTVPAERLSTPTATPTCTSTAVPPTATMMPPTSTSTPTFTPSPTSTPIVLPPPENPGPPKKPPMIARGEWGSMEIAEGYVPHTLDRITLHHDGAEFHGGAKARLRGLQSWSIRVRGWVDVPYHYLIDLEGNIYEARPLQFVGDTATEYDPTGHALITLMGNYNSQDVNQAQLASIVELASWICYEYSIPPQMIRGHRDYAATSCPGTNLYRYLADGYLVRAVEERVSVEGP